MGDVRTYFTINDLKKIINYHTLLLLLQTTTTKTMATANLFYAAFCTPTFFGKNLPLKLKQ